MWQPWAEFAVLCLSGRVSSDGKTRSFGSLAKPRGSLNRILFHAVAIGVALAQAVLCVSIALFGGFAEPPRIFGTLAARLAQAGRGADFRIQDLWLAAQAVQSRCTLLTRNAKDFQDIPVLKFVALKVS